MFMAFFQLPSLTRYIATHAAFSAGAAIAAISLTSGIVTTRLFKLEKKLGFEPVSHAGIPHLPTSF
jgi:hypothetical protein